MNDSPFAQFAEIYRAAGYWPRPIQPGTKACKLGRWQEPDPDQGKATLDAMVSQFGHQGIGLLLGSPFSDGSVLGALDIDDDDFVRVARVLLGDPPCGRIGARGALFFVRVYGEVSFRRLNIKPTGDKPGRAIGELLVCKHLAVIPPTIHPETRSPYRWIGQPLHETDPNDLPVLEVEK